MKKLTRLKFDNKPGVDIVNWQLRWQFNRHPGPRVNARGNWCVYFRRHNCTLLQGIFFLIFIKFSKVIKDSKLFSKDFLWSLKYNKHRNTDQKLRFKALKYLKLNDDDLSLKLNSYGEEANLVEIKNWKSPHSLNLVEWHAREHSNEKGS